jgi:GNAT superfamily N-acetyltransferase
VGAAVPQIEQLAELTPADRSAIVAPLDAFGSNLGFVWKPRPLVLALRDEQGAIAGGLIGELLWEWLQIKILSVAEGLRGQGWGRRLVAQAERLAVEGGCHHAWVDTFSFQARPFYEKLGYRVFGQLPDYPAPQTRYFLAKALGASGAWA